MLENFHFLQPLWFLLLIPMTLLLWWLHKISADDTNWSQVCESHLLPHLLVLNTSQAGSRSSLWLLIVAWLLGVLALADPVWEQHPQPLYRDQAAVVIVLDLSRSMLSADLTPTRLERARFKVAEMLKQRQEGQTGLVVFAGEAFVVSPLTDDTGTILSLLQTLRPDLMPTQDSRADLGILLAGQRMQKAGIKQGQIMLVTDGYSDERILAVATKLKQLGYRLSVLAVGSNAPLPISNGRGGVLRDRKGVVIIPTMDAVKLQQLATTGGGRYSLITTDNTDLERLLPVSSASQEIEVEQGSPLYDVWQSQGPWLVLLLLPLAALAFRRGWLLGLMLASLSTLGTLPSPVMASAWDDLWSRREQQAAQALGSGDLEQARQLSEQPLRQGEAAYRAGDYEKALSVFSALEGAQADYNRGNSLAQLKRYKEAIAAYDQALATQPGMEDAMFNKTLLEELLQLKATEGDGEQSDEPSEQQGKSDGKGKGDTPGTEQNEQQNQDQNNEQAEREPGNNTDTIDENSDTQADEQTASDENAEAEAKDEQQAEQQAEADQQQAQEDASKDAQQDPGEPDDSDSSIETVSLEQQKADELWLRRVPDDPGGLLRRKFLHQYKKRAIGEERIGPQGQGW